MSEEIDPNHIDVIVHGMLTQAAKYASYGDHCELKAIREPSRREEYDAQREHWYEFAKKYLDTRKQVIVIKGFKEGKEEISFFYDEKEARDFLDENPQDYDMRTYQPLSERLTDRKIKEIL